MPARIHANASMSGKTKKQTAVAVLLFPAVLFDWSVSKHHMCYDWSLPLIYGCYFKKPGGDNALTSHPVCLLLVH